MNPKELVEKLKQQHRQLRSDLSGALADAQAGIVKNEQEILEYMAKFRRDLSEHIALENEVFYPDFIAKKLKNGEDITEVSKFVDEMKKIGYGVNEFLEKYDTPEELEDIGRDFVGDLTHIISALNIRIESEEDGVFEFYLLLE